MNRDSGNLLCNMEKPPDNKPSADDNDPEQELSGQVEPVKDLQVDPPESESDEETKPVPVASSTEGRSLRLADIYKVDFEPSLPSKGPMQEFVKLAKNDFGLPETQSWALWIFATLAYCGHRIFHDDGCVERRIASNVVLAGDDEAGLARRITVEALGQCEGIKVMTSPDSLQLEDYLQDFSDDVRRVVVDTGDENIFLKWSKKASKQEISLAQLFCPDSFNDYLSGSVRADAMPPVRVPILLHCELKDILIDRKFPFCVFRDSLVVPSFGCRKARTFSSEQMHKLLEHLRSAFVDFQNEISVSFTPDAKQELDVYMENCSHRSVALSNEGNHAHYRRCNVESHILALATAYSIDASGESFEGKIKKSAMLRAIADFSELDRQWDEMDDLYERASRADEIDNVYHMILTKFAGYDGETSSELIVPFQELATAFCHHPDRPGQYTTGYLQRNILSEIVASGRAKLIHGKRRRDRKWVFYRKLIGLV